MHTSPRLSEYEAVVIGGGPAGLSAALSLGRARRRVLVAAAGPTRNAAADAAHNVFTRDGTPPAELVRIGREQLAPYEVAIRETLVTDVARAARHFLVTFSGGEEVLARGLVLATGVRDVLPDIPGLAERWGHGVFHCPYCHGWEVAGRPLAVYAGGLPADRTLHLVRLIRGWSNNVMLFTNGPCTLPTDDRARVERNGVMVREDRLAALVGPGREIEGVVLEGGEIVACGGMIISPNQALHSDLPQRLGCTLSADGRVEAGLGGRTNIPGVFVAGDVGPGMQSVINAMATGTLAGAMLNHEFLEEDFH